MKMIPLSLLALTLGVSLASAATEEEKHKTFSVQPGGQLMVDVDFGSVEVRTNGTQEVVIDVWRKIGRGSKAEEEAFLRDSPVTFSQEGKTVTVTAKNRTKSNWNWFWGSKNQNDAKYIITVPSQFSARLKTAGGKILAQDLTGNMAAHTSGGTLEFARLQGPLEGHTSGGNIKATDCRGTLKIETSGGNIDVAGGGGSLNGDTSGGSIKVSDFAGPARLETSGGSITVERVTGTVEGTTSGGSIMAVLPSPLPGAVKLSTSGGSVTARIADGTAFELDAETSGGGVSSQLPVTTNGKPGQGRLKGPVNGGGTRVELRTSGGSIRVEKLPGKAQARN